MRKAFYAIGHISNDIDTQSLGLSGVTYASIVAQLFPRLVNLGHLAVAAQGYFKEVEHYGNIKPKTWTEIDSLRYADLAILSNKDITFNSNHDIILSHLREACPLLVITGIDGSTVFDKNKNIEIHVLGFSLRKRTTRDFDSTNTEDARTAAFIRYYFESSDIKETAVFAELYSAIIVETVRDTGFSMSAIPNIKQVHEFTRMNYRDVHNFLLENNLSSFSLFPEGSFAFKERR